MEVRLLIVIRVLTLNNWTRHYRYSVDRSIPRLTDHFELWSLQLSPFAVSDLPLLSAPNDVRSRGHLVQMEVSADKLIWRRMHPSFVDIADTSSSTVPIENFEGSTYVIFQRGLPLPQDQRSRSREAYSVEPLKYASLAAFTCRDPWCVM